MKKTVVAAVTFWALVLGATLALAHHGPEVINLDKFKKAMAPVKFEHHKHQDRVNMDCLVCHHMAKAGDTAPKPCSECHQAKAGDAPSYKDALHKNCQGCHKEQKAAGKNPPLKCNECHVK